jgi:hypothetical protein
MSSYKHIASVGSSFAAGPGIPEIVDVNACRSNANYASLLGAPFALDLRILRK